MDQTLRQILGALAAGAVLATTGCMPSLPYMHGTAFYSESVSKAQMQAAANEGKVKFLGRFTQDSTACGNYVQDWADSNLVLPVVKSNLSRLGGNAADNIVAKLNFSDVVLGCLILPAIGGCRSFTISGEALLVQP